MKPRGLFNFLSVRVGREHNDIPEQISVLTLEQKKGVETIFTQKLQVNFTNNYKMARNTLN